jgi:uncharacterized repeat protein (TIGR03803 family)
MKKLSLEKIACIVAMFCAVSGAAAFAQTFTTLARFAMGNGTSAGYPPQGPLAQGLNGDFYGTTSYGGAGAGGTVFEMTPGGSLTELYGFFHGSYPDAGLVLGTDGNFYGTISGGEGAVFEIDAGGGVPTVLHFFCRDPLTCGYNTVAGLVQGTDGDFYGTTSSGGPNDDGGADTGGTVFEITPLGKFTSLYSFCSQPGCTDGAVPVAALIQATDGNFYGTTAGGGANNGGTIFKITPAGVLTTLYSFCSLANCADGASPQTPLIQAADGNFYGTTTYGGPNENDETCPTGCGTIFEMTPAGKLTTLYSFCSQSGCPDGAVPEAGLLQATDGNFYGTTAFGGAHSASLCDYGKTCGTLFQITPARTLTTLHSFCADMSQLGNCGDGALPTTSLVQATHGGIYGTTYTGGLGGESDTTYYDCCGTVFFLSMGLGPFIETVGTSREVGATVTILGNDLGRTSSVAFNGTAATFTVVSSTEITATVPTGATTGFVTVTTPIATLTSNKKFRVEP